MDDSRLAKEDTLCQESLSEPERQWLREHRPDEARYWNLLTDWRPESLRYAGGGFVIKKFDYSAARTAADPALTRHE